MPAIYSPEILPQWAPWIFPEKRRILQNLKHFVVLANNCKAALPSIITPQVLFFQHLSFGFLQLCLQEPNKYPIFFVFKCLSDLSFNSKSPNSSNIFRIVEQMWKRLCLKWEGAIWHVYYDYVPNGMTLHDGTMRYIALYRLRLYTLNCNFSQRQQYFYHVAVHSTMLHHFASHCMTRHHMTCLDIALTKYCMRQ